jgi:DNA-binding beta-propeller fold protein YncE
VSKLNPAGTDLAYSTFLSTNVGSQGNGIAVDARGDAYVTGAASDPHFPTTDEAYQPVPLGSPAAFVTKLNQAGSGLVYSTFVGGTDEGHGIAVDPEGSAYITGMAAGPNFPTTPGASQTAAQGGQDAFVTELNPAGSGLTYSTSPSKVAETRGKL